MRVLNKIMCHIPQLWYPQYLRWQPDPPLPTSSLPLGSWGTIFNSQHAKHKFTPLSSPVRFLPQNNYTQQFFCVPLHLQIVHFHINLFSSLPPELYTANMAGSAFKSFSLHRTPTKNVGIQFINRKYYGYLTRHLTDGECLG